MVGKRRIVKKRIGDLLIERSVITREQLNEALAIQANNKKLLGEILVELGYATEEEIMVAITTQYGIPFLPLESYEIDAEVIKSASVDLVHKYNFIPIDKIGDMLTIVVADILDENVMSQIESSFGCKVESFVTTPSILKKAIEKYYG